MNSRYYNPEWGRFINADGIIGANMDILANNLYAYGSNNPINGYDPTGQWFIKAITSIVNAIKNLCGLEYTSASTQSRGEDLNVKFPGITAEFGANVSTYFIRKGSSDKPISVYIHNNNNSILDSSIGVKLNVLKTSLTLNVGANDISLNYAIKSRKMENSSEFGISPKNKANIYFSAKSTVIEGNIETTTYIKSSMSPLIPIAAYAITRTPSTLLKLEPRRYVYQ